MDTLHEEVLRALVETLTESPEKADELDIEGLIADMTPKLVESIKESLMESAQGMLDERRQLSKGFEERNIKRWEKAFDVLETHIVICTEAGEGFNDSYRSEAGRDSDLVFDLVVRHHARACHISQEILCLLKSGFADGAQARWRALHEVNITAMFIAKHGQECAERFYHHDVVDAYDRMRTHQRYEDRLAEKAPTQDEIDECKKDYDSLIQRYGKKFANHYGWASCIFPKLHRVSFAAIEEDVELDHMRPYYKWASQNIHAGSRGMRERLGLSEAKEDILLVGQSNSGMTDPAHAAAISLCQVTATLLMLKPNIDHIVVARIMLDYARKVGQSFLDVERETSLAEQE